MIVMIRLQESVRPFARGSMQEIRGAGAWLVSYKQFCRDGEATGLMLQPLMAGSCFDRASQKSELGILMRTAPSFFAAEMFVFTETCIINGPLQLTMPWAKTSIALVSSIRTTQGVVLFHGKRFWVSNFNAHCRQVSMHLGTDNGIET